MISQRVVALLWPGLFVLVALQLYLVSSGRVTTKRDRYLLILAAMSGLFVVYEVVIVRRLLRWILTLVGLAIPLVVGMTAVRYIVEEV